MQGFVNLAADEPDTVWVTEVWSDEASSDRALSSDLGEAGIGDVIALLAGCTSSPVGATAAPTTTAAPRTTVLPTQPAPSAVLNVPVAARVITFVQPAPVGVRLEEQRGEGRHGRDQSEREARQRPPLVDRDDDGDEAVGDEHHAVHHPEDLDAELGGLGDVLEEHPGEQQRPGDRLGDRHGPEETAWVHANTAAVRLVKKPSPSVLGPVRSSTACSGCGMRPTTRPFSLVTPAMSLLDPLGLPPT